MSHVHERPGAGARFLVSGTTSSFEPAYWERHPDGTFESFGQPGPSVVVQAGANGVTVLRWPSLKPVDTFRSVGEARWVATRIIEACAIYETHFAKIHDPVVQKDHTSE